MNTKTVYSTKAEKYSKYRWDYAADAIDKIFETTQLSVNSSIADIGAGTGILTKHLAHRAGRVYAIEPNTEMRQILARKLAGTPSVSVMDSCAEATGLPEKSVDVITVAQAIHWFDPEPARNEMRRILKDYGWLVLLRNYGTDEGLNQAVGGLMTEEYGANFSATDKKPKERPVGYFFGNENYQTIHFPFQFNQYWEEFIGSLLSASYTPDEDNPLFEKFKNTARDIFDSYCNEGLLLVHGTTEMIIGQPLLTDPIET
jgi:ubiquinone/menaquinone biosynthesis C-methylase UbiE